LASCRNCCDRSLSADSHCEHSSSNKSASTPAVEVFGTAGQAISGSAVVKSGIFARAKGAFWTILAKPIVQVPWEVCQADHLKSVVNR
jgi:hypothetical protein